MGATSGIITVINMHVKLSCLDDLILDIFDFCQCYDDQESDSRIAVCLFYLATVSEKVNHTYQWRSLVSIKLIDVKSHKIQDLLK